MTEHDEIMHDQVHREINDWCRQASELFGDLVNRMEALEHEAANLRARVAEWEQSPR